MDGPCAGEWTTRWALPPLCCGEDSWAAGCQEAVRFPLLLVVCVQHAALACHFITRSPAPGLELRPVSAWRVKGGASFHPSLPDPARAGTCRCPPRPPADLLGPCLPPWGAVLPTRQPHRAEFSFISSLCPCPAPRPRFCPCNSRRPEGGGGASSHILLASAQMSGVWTELSQQFRLK